MKKQPTHLRLVHDDSNDLPIDTNIDQFDDHPFLLDQRFDQDYDLPEKEFYPLSIKQLRR